jgi:hypothetical protein
LKRNKNDDAGVNKTVKPTATMKLYKDGVDIGGSDVKLTDLVTMTIQVDDEFIGIFFLIFVDIKGEFMDSYTCSRYSCVSFGTASAIIRRLMERAE